MKLPYLSALTKIDANSPEVWVCEMDKLWGRFDDLQKGHLVVS
jgi:hypothetical protein